MTQNDASVVSLLGIGESKEARDSMANKEGMLGWLSGAKAPRAKAAAALGALEQELALVRGNGTRTGEFRQGEVRRHISAAGAAHAAATREADASITHA